MFVKETNFSQVTPSTVGDHRLRSADYPSGSNNAITLFIERERKHQLIFFAL